MKKEKDRNSDNAGQPLASTVKGFDVGLRL